MPYAATAARSSSSVSMRSERAQTISFIIPTVGRPSLTRTLDSIEAWDGDEVLVIKHDPPGGHWGNVERQDGLDRAGCDYVAFIDDDDRYVKGHRKIMAAAIAEAPWKPLLFRIRYPNGAVLWRPSNVAGRPPRLKNGNVSSQMICFPNDKAKLPRWDLTHSFADYYFIARTGWGNRSGFIWRPEVLVLMGHDTSTGRGSRNIKAP